MPKSLVIVESPTKVRTIKKVLGKDFDVQATVGHILDLPKSEIGIDVDKEFERNYVKIPGKAKVITKLKKAANGAETIFLAPDPDREGEAIAWHTAQVLTKKGRIFRRVLFHELTKNAILKAISEPRDLDKPKYEAQQARRILDRLVGYQVSPLLWRKVKGGLSAGRVQSVALRIICEREREVQAFEPEEYWTIDALLNKEGGPSFLARLVKKKGAKIRIPDEATAKGILEDLERASFVVAEVKKKRVRKNPYPPFTTSKLQQEAIKKLRFSAKKTMMIAQQLYEGIDLGPGEPVGLITYMRTDSTRISNEAGLEALDYIQEVFGREYRPAKVRQFRNKKKVQDAHEAIRPSQVRRTPQQVAGSLTRDQLALYTLIWKRFVASQMEPAQMDQTSIFIEAGPYLFTTSGSIIAFPGFLALYQVEDEKDKEGEKTLPALLEKDPLICNELDPKQHFTQPPPRFSEATLVKELEENGIGRPSTYASILSTIRDKNYVELIKGYFRPSELGLIVNDLLVANFADIFNVAFTAKMEDDLDRIESDEAKFVSVLEGFYGSFQKDLSLAGKEMVSVKGVGLPANKDCPTCGKALMIKIGRNGPFAGCTGYPDCRFTANYSRDEKGGVVLEETPKEQETDEVCEKCGRPMVVKTGRYGPFTACSGYPECKNTRSVNGGGGKGTGVKCPNEKCEGNLEERRSKRGKVFYGCSKYPDCTYATWDRPVDKRCPVCDSPHLVEKVTKKDGTTISCPNRECGYKEKQEG